jgi:UDP:flavonoid glycosyltransferase YjiC (YdhE family)
MRAQETKHGIKMHRSNWGKDELLKNIEDTINDNEISNNLKKASDFMKSDNGAEKAAALIVDLN